MGADRSRDVVDVEFQGKFWRRLAELILPEAEANAPVLKSVLGRWWNEEDSKRILRRVVLDMDAVGTEAILREMPSLKSECGHEIREELKNLVGPDYSADLVRKVHVEMMRWLGRKLRDELGYPRLEIRRCSAAADGEEKVCSICLDRLYRDDEMIASLDCGHDYHSHCITQWLMKGENVCPLCRGTALRVSADNRAFFMLGLL